jgi:hypothetical protein
MIVWRHSVRRTANLIGPGLAFGKRKAIDMVRATGVRKTVLRIAGCRAKCRRGAIVVLAAFLVIVMVAMLAFSIDIGYMLLGRAEIQRAVDAGALGGAGMLAEGPDAARQTALDFTMLNPVGRRNLRPANIEIEVGQWNIESRTFVPAFEQVSSVRVFARQDDQPLFFGRIFGGDHHSVEAEAIANYQPRDIMVVLDYSSSMNDDSELGLISELGRTAIEENLRQIYTELGSPRFGKMQWQPVYISSNSTRVVKKQLGLQNVRYPYPSGSWEDYFNYVQTSSVINRAGYRKRYGYLTLVNYWLEVRPTYGETPDLWKTSEQPITAVKDAMTVFLDYIGGGNTSDRVGLAVYTSEDGTSKLEKGLTDNYQLIEEISRQRQAGHYTRSTNIGAGIAKARQELNENSRPGTFKMIVLMTDGMANRPGSESDAKRYVRDEAQRAADDRYPIISISLGADADRDLMQEVADITGGVHFNIPGGQRVADYERQLKEVFREIAKNRPLKLVK